MKKAWIALVVLAAAAVLFLRGGEPPPAQPPTAPAAPSAPRPEAAAAPAPGDAPPAADVPAAPADGRVEARGTVKDEQGLPVPGVEVLVLEGEEPAKDEKGARTGQDGRFSLRLEPLGWVQVEARHPDFVAARGWVRPGDTAGATLVLRHGARLTVSVRRPDGRPAEGAEARAIAVSRQGVQGVWSWREERPVASGKTGPDGRAVLGNAPEGNLLVGVVHAEFAAARAEVEVHGRDPVEIEVTLGYGGTVSGRVLDPEGKPVAGARVRVEGDAERSATTAADGTFVLRAVREGPAQVIAEAEGFGPGWFGERIGWGEPVPVPVSAAHPVEGVEIVLSRAGWVVGRVLDAEGAPAAGVAVFGWATPVVGDLAPTATDAEGRFRLGPLALRGPGQAWVWFESPTHEVPRVEALAVVPGEERDTGDLRASPLGVVRGVVKDADGTPVSAGSVEAEGEQHFTATSIRPDGTFELTGLRPGAVTLKAAVDFPPAPSLRSVAVAITVAAGEPTEGVELRVRPSRSIAGRVVTPSGEPRVAVHVVALGRDPAGGGARHETLTGVDGAFTFDALPEGEYAVGLAAAGGEAGDAGGMAKDPPPVVAAAGASGIEFRAERKGAVVRGRAVAGPDPRPVFPLDVSVMPLDNGVPTGLSTSGFEGADGVFTVETDGPGTFAVEVSAEGYAAHRFSPLELKVGEVRDLGDVALGSGGGVAGEIRDAAGNAVPYTRINLLSQKLETNEDEPFTDFDGRYEMKGIPPGTYTVFAVSPRHPLCMVRGVRVEEGKVARADIAFADPAPLTVRVAGEDGEPIEGVDLSYTFDAVKPVTSRMFRGKEPPGWGPHETDAEGRIRKPCLPAGEVTLFLAKTGYYLKSETVTLDPGKSNEVDIVLRKK